MTDIKKLIIFVTATLVVVILLVAAIVGSAMKMGDTPGLFRPDEPPIYSSETEDDRQEKYDSREQLPDTIYESLDSIVLRYLSLGDFRGLDDRLAGWLETYKENDNDALAVMDEIESYRADLSYIMAISNYEAPPVSPWRFYNSDFLAAAVAYTSISHKYEAMISHQSAIMAPALSNIALHKAEKTPAELREILDTINLTRSASNEYQMVAVYNMTIFGYETEFIAVSDTASMQWQPYSLTVLNDSEFSITVALCYELLAQKPSTNLDSILAFMPQAY